MSTPIGPYSPVVQVGPWRICSGQLGVAPTDDPDGAPSLVGGGPAAQLSRALANAAALLHEAGASVGDVVKTTVFLTSMDDAPDVNRAYADFFGGHRPARSMVAAAGLPMGAGVEVEVWAYVASGDERGRS